MVETFILLNAIAINLATQQEEDLEQLIKVVFKNKNPRQYIGRGFSYNAIDLS